MRTLYAGCPSISVPPLDALAEVSDVVGVLTNPGKPCGRNKKIRETPVKRKALELKIPVVETDSVKEADEQILSEIKDLSAELLVVFAYGVILPGWFLNLFPLGGINIHPSLLPKYRGPSPIPAVILAGEEKTGITVQRLSEKMDAGNILLQKTIYLLGGETTEGLERDVAEFAGPLLKEVVTNMASGELREQPQKEEEATYCRLISKDDSHVDWQFSAERIDRMVRAYYPWPKARTSWKGREVYLLQGSPVLGGEEDLAAESGGDGEIPGTVLGVDKTKGILVQTGNGVYAIKRLQLQSKKPLSFKDFLNGNRDFLETRLGV